MKVIVPCAGSSSRFPGMSPKWMLPDHDGVPMVVRAVEGLGVRVDQLVITYLAEHEERFSVAEGLAKAFGQRVNTVVLTEPTRSQSETVYETVQRAAITESFLVKDSDNFFNLKEVEKPYSYVSVASLNDFDHINPRNKSYVQVDHNDVILNLREKRVISDLFSVGGYYFSDPDEFAAAYRELAANPTLQDHELYLSEVISYMAMKGHAFKVQTVTEYEDWGTVREWRSVLDRRRTYFVSVDGFLFERGSSYFGTSFSASAPHLGAVRAIDRLSTEGHRIIYLSIRPSSEEAATRSLIEAAGLPSGALILECGVSQWNIVTAAHQTLPFLTSQSFELDPSDPNLDEKLSGTLNGFGSV